MNIADSGDVYCCNLWNSWIAKRLYNIICPSNLFLIKQFELGYCAPHYWNWPLTDLLWSTLEPIMGYRVLWHELCNLVTAPLPWQCHKTFSSLFTLSTYISPSNFIMKSFVQSMKTIRLCWKYNDKTVEQKGYININ